MKITITDSDIEAGAQFITPEGSLYLVVTNGPKSFTFVDLLQHRLLNTLERDSVKEYLNAWNAIPVWLHEILESRKHNELIRSQAAADADEPQDGPPPRRL